MYRNVHRTTVDNRKSITSCVYTCESFMHNFCTHGAMAVSGCSIDLDPGGAREFTFQIRTYKALGSDYSCEVQLFDADYNLIQSAQVSFATNGTCFCYGICGCVVRA